jgi:hypothetical protein
MNNILILVLFIFAYTSNAQIKNYFIEGEIQNIHQGKIFLVANSMDSAYYRGSNTLDSSKIENGVFKFKRNAIKNEPLAYRLIIRNESKVFSTGIILLSSKDRKIEIDSIDEYISPDISNSIHQKELCTEYFDFFKQIVAESRNLFNNQDSLYEIYGKKMPEEIKQKFYIAEKKLSEKSNALFLTMPLIIQILM